MCRGSPRAGPTRYATSHGRLTDVPARLALSHRRKEGEGVDMMRFDEDGLIEDYRVMVRPLSAVVALRDAAFSQLPEAS